MKKVLLIPSNTDLNRGDQALVWESIRLIEDIYEKDVDITIMASENDVDADLQKKQTAALGFRFIPALLNHPGRRVGHKKDDSRAYTKTTIVRWGLQAISDFFHTFMLLSKVKPINRIGRLFINARERAILGAFEDADAVYVKGGGFIHSYGGITDPYFIYFLTFHIRLAIACSKKVYVLPNSIGPLKNNIARHMALSTLKRCTLVTTREGISKNYLCHYGVNSVLYPDLGFFLQPANNDFATYLESNGVPINHNKVVLTLRPYRFQGFENADILFENYVNGICNLVRHLHSKGYHTTFAAHTLGPSTHEDDRLAIKVVMERLSDADKQMSSYLEDINLNCRDLESVYSYFDYMIGTRFHSVIFSLNVNVPSIAIAYGGNKGKGIMSVLGNDDYAVDMDKIEENTLIEIFEKLEHEREIYLKNLSEKRRWIELKRDELIDSIRGFEDFKKV